MTIREDFSDCFDRGDILTICTIKTRTGAVEIRPQNRRISSVLRDSSTERGHGRVHVQLIEQVMSFRDFITKSNVTAAVNEQKQKYYY